MANVQISRSDSSDDKVSIYAMFDNTWMGLKIYNKSGSPACCFGVHDHQLVQITRHNKQVFSKPGRASEICQGSEATHSDDFIHEEPADGGGAVSGDTLVCQPLGSFSSALCSKGQQSDSSTTVHIPGLPD